MKISDKKASKVIEDLVYNESPNEDVMKDALIVKLQLLIDIRQLLRKMYKGTAKQKTYKRPTNNKKDIIVGENGI